ncbi:MAG: hypothetical protein OXC63_05175 [Aestuariivita sp.]|nr:hypothetical protein [Aestuariivita sp.]MCY4346924.1 hypothetical protein [Aestuariivita sp.]
MTLQPIDDVRTAQRHLLDKIKHFKGVKGVGIALNSARDTYTLEVLVDIEQPPTEIPAAIDGVPVTSKPVGEIVTT